jgi:phosphate transport system substrate-binding protein
MLRSVFCAALAATALITTPALARDQIRAMGSSTVFPFVAAVAEHYADKTGERAPIVESIGTGAGFVEFCKGVGEGFSDIANASRLMLDSEKADCLKNGVSDIAEIEIGKDGIVIASNANSDAFPVTKKQIFLALAKQVPVGGKLVDNPYTTWKSVDASLPDMAIEVYGPSITSGTRDAFAELAMEPVCVTLPEFKAAYTDKSTLKKACHALREDGKYIEAGENDNLIVQKLFLNEKAVGIFGYGYMEQNIDKVLAHTVDGVAPEYENIADGSYPISRGMYAYVKKAHIAVVKGLKEFLTEMTSEDAISDEGYLADKGLIALPEKLREEMRVRVKAL